MRINYGARRARPYTHIRFLFGLAALLALTLLCLSRAPMQVSAAGSPAPDASPTPPCPLRRAGAEFRVNATGINGYPRARAAMDADGDFVVVWGNAAGVYFRLFDSSGVARGPEQNAAKSPDNYPDPSVSMDAGGDFVIVWQSNNVMEGERVHARRYGAGGEPLGDEFRVGTYPNIFEIYPSVAMDAAGEFVVTWLGGWATTGPVIFSRSYNAAGAPFGIESPVTRPDHFPVGPLSVAMGPSGHTVFTWVGGPAGGPSQQVYARRQMMSTVRVSAAEDGTEMTPAVAVDAAGNFVVAWANARPGAPQPVIYARMFASGGEARGAEFEVGEGSGPSVATGADGDFVIAWTKTGTNALALYARHYSSAGVPDGPELLVSDGRGGASVATDGSGDVVIASGSLASPRDLYAQLYTTSCPTPNAVIAFGSPTYEVTEGCVPAEVNVNLLTAASPPAGAVSVDYTVEDGTASQKNDYTYAAGTLSFSPGELSKTITILINEDGYAEGTESLRVRLSNPVGAVLSKPPTATLNILDNDGTDSAANPVDDPRAFVCQHYHDFLHRQPDAGGQEFWTEQITRCGADAACVAAKRVSVSAAFFLSIEFQQTGYFEERLYEACLGRRPSYEEFVRDVARIGAGVEVGVGDWAERLEQNKRAFSEEFVARAEFKAKYPEGMAAGEYVDEMFEYAGVEPSAAERQAALDVYGAGDVQGRAAAMRAVVESASVFRAYYNRGFVLTEYFGYLRRDPPDPPDQDWTGYDFWLRKMDAFSLPGEDVVRESDAFARVRRAEMVRAFIESAEYRQRFGK